MRGAGLSRRGGQSSAVQEGDAILTPSRPKGRGRGRGSGTSTISSSPQSPTVSRVALVSAKQDGLNGRNDFTGRAEQQSTNRRHTVDSDKDKVMEMPGGKECAPEMEERRVSDSGESSSRAVPHSATRTVPKEIYSRSIERRFAVLKSLGGGGGTPVKAGTSNVKDNHYRYIAKVPGASEVRSDDITETLFEEDEEYREEAWQCSQPRPQELTHDVDLFSKGPNDNLMADYDDDQEPIDGGDEAGVDEEDDDKGMEGFAYPTEVQRKRERRQEKAWLEKEGDKRRAEGKPRNFLLVDERTGRPYGVGVGDWRKELMLLSRDLDPAIGNINRQPEGAVTEIAEWIQHTWEYSSPPKSECVKEVIARGVTLRRVDLWKRIRNGERKPAEVSDRTWLTLERQLENPASIKKSENCRIANASRVNFGRTGPSGEVGLRQRMKKILRRSPDPDEVRFEMARDKGYGRRRWMKENSMHITEGTGVFKKVCTDVPRICAPTGNSQNNSGDSQGKGSAGIVSNEDVGPLPGVADRQHKVNTGRLSEMSVDELCEHPFVAKMIQRLQALEGEHNMTTLAGPRETSEAVYIHSDGIGGTGEQQTSPEFQDAAHPVELVEAEGTRASTRLRNKAK